MRFISRTDVVERGTKEVELAENQVSQKPKELAICEYIHEELKKW